MSAKEVAAGINTLLWGGIYNPLIPVRGARVLLNKMGLMLGVIVSSE